MNDALEAVRQLAATDQIRAQELNLEITQALSRYAASLNQMLAGAPTSLPPAVKNAVQSSINADFPTASEFEFVGVVDQITTQLWVVSTTPVVITPQTEIKGTISTGDTVKVHVSTGPENTLIAREIEISIPGEPGSSNTNDIGNLNSNSNEDFDDNGNNQGNTNAGTNLNGNEDDGTGDRQGGETRFTGIVSQMGSSVWLVSGVSLSVTSDTEIHSGIAVGSLIEVEAVTAPDGSLVATRLRLADSSGSGSGDSDDNQNNANSNNSNGNMNDNQGNSNGDGFGDDNGNSNDNSSDSANSNAGDDQDNGNDNGDDNGSDSSGKGGGDDHGNDNDGSDDGN
jgi:hypothetical protein